MRVLALLVVTGGFGLVLEGEARAESRLTVERVFVGSADGTVRSVDGSIDCPSTCSHDTARGRTYALNATAAPGSTFLGWSGCGSASGPTCTVTLPFAPDIAPGVPVLLAAAVTATFGRLYELTVGVRGSGMASSEPAGIACGATCTASYLVGTEVTLTASPRAAFVFAGWEGACSGRGTCTVTLDQARRLTAVFRPATGTLRSTPRRPAAGRTFVLMLPVQPSFVVRKASCAADVRGRHLRVRAKRVRPGAVVCRWHLPRTARGGLLRARIQVSDAQMQISRPFVARVV